MDQQPRRPRIGTRYPHGRRSLGHRRRRRRQYQQYLHHKHQPRQFLIRHYEWSDSA